MLFDFSNESQATRHREARGHYDLSLVLAALMLASLGIVMVSSSSIAVADGQHVGPFYYLLRHLVFIALGLLPAVVMTLI